MLNAVVWIARSGAPLRNLPERYGPWEAHTIVTVNRWMTAYMTIFFTYPAWTLNFRKYRPTPLLSRPISKTTAPERTVPPAEIDQSRGDASTKIHAAVDAYGCPVYIMISEGQRNDINFAVPVPEHIKNSSVLADRWYDSNKTTDYIYDYCGEPTIPFGKCAKYQRRCNWRLYKERHLVEKFLLKLKSFRKIAARYNRLSFTYPGFIYLVSILIWLK